MQKAKLPYRWAGPLLAVEFLWQWIAYLLSNWSFLAVLEYLGSFSVLIAVIFYYSESGDRLKQKHYQAWQVINTAQGKGGSGGRLEALQELNADKVPLVGVDVSGAFLQGIHLEKSSLTRANFSSADLRDSDLSSSDLTFADFHSANLRHSDLQHASLAETDLRDSDLVGVDLRDADLAHADLGGADLRDADLGGFRWQELKNIQKANIAGVRHAPPDFIVWAKAHGAIEDPNAD